MLLTGGGTGGHITPLLAVADEIKKQRPKTDVLYVGERGGSFQYLTNNHPNIDATYGIFCGKFRRYHGQSWLARLVDIRSIVLNLRDAVFVLVGIVQAWFLLGRINPDVIFLKGGFVGVPVGLAAAVRGIPYVTHDSDALPGLANRIVGRWATWHATALPAQEYAYPVKNTEQVGVIVGKDYKYITPSLQIELKKSLSIQSDHKLLLITGGSLGAVRLNKAIAKLSKQILNEIPELEIIHQVGKGKTGVYDGFTHKRLKVLEFLTPMHVYSGAADVVITRAGANTLAELGVQGKACIVVPNPDLTGGHQLHNAQKLEEQGAVVVVKETQLNTELVDTLKKLLSDKKNQTSVGKKFAEITIKNAASKIATLLLTEGEF